MGLPESAAYLPFLSPNFSTFRSRALNFEIAVQQFIANETWLTAAHAPSVVALQAVAIELDREVTAALIAQFGMLHRSLLKERPSVQTDIDPLAELLRRGL